MDLRTSYPRSIRDKLAGYVHLARMIDKCRATLAGTQGEYIYPCPLDKRLLDFAGITPEQFAEAVRGKTDQAIADWFRKAAKPHSHAEIEQWNTMMLTRGPDTPEKWEYFRTLRDAVDPTRTDITSWADLLDLDEKRPVPTRKTVAAGGQR
ncbi:MAG: DUF5069 domain-containing protein [Nitrospira sp.]|nr:DUF5069 domain-containing protein [Nitrospira sp.]